MNIDNVETYLRNNYDRRVLLNYRTVKKYYLRISLVGLDIHFLKSCRSKDIIPKFLWFKTANQNLASSSAYKECQRRLLKAEINYKYKHLNKVKEIYRYSTSLLEQCCSTELFQGLQQIITDICYPLITSKKETVERKLNNHCQSTISKHALDREVVKNLSSRVLSNDEIDCLAHGLDYGLIPRRFDELNAVGNIEQFFHRVTDIYQNHRKLMKDIKDNDVVISNDVHVLNTKEMTLASNLRGLTDSFRFQADRYRKRQSMMQVEQKEYHQLLRQLKNDKSIVVTRRDKGRGIVLMNTDDYVAKMNTILDDSTKFTCLSSDPTITRERKLTNLLRKIKDQGDISKQLYDMIRPTGSSPGRLYGLPKVHKDNIPLRPVLSAIGTYNYGIAKFLKQMLSNIVQNEVIIKDSFTFVKELKSIPDLLPKPTPEYKMVSFDIVSLYTNIPLDETIKIILNHLYDNPTTPPVIKRDDMEELLKIATKDSHFLFNGKVYDQIDGVSMGSPLAPLLAEIFLQDFEKKHLPSFKEMGILYWKRYVDDTFVLLDSKVSVKDICAKLSQCHPSLKFTSEDEELVKPKPKKEESPSEQKNASEEKKEPEKEDLKTYSLSFLDILVERQGNKGFQSRVYRKLTFSGLITKWDSFVPKRYKYNAISSMAYRAMRICSTYEALHNEFDFIRELALKNGYPLAFVESVIRRQLNLVYEPRVITPKPLETDFVVLRVPYYGQPSQIYAKRVTAAVAKQYPLKTVRVVYDVTARIGQNFTTKDKIPTEMKSGVVYEATCPQCKDQYIGKTCRHLKTRIYEHLSDQNKFMPPTVQSSAKKQKKTSSSQKQKQTSSSKKVIVANSSSMTTRSKTRLMQQTATGRKTLTRASTLLTSSRIIQKHVHVSNSQGAKTLPIKHNLDNEDISKLLMSITLVDKNKSVLVAKSALSKHYVSTGHVISGKDFQILLSEQHWYRLLVKESLLIRKKDPKLNGTDRSLPLYIYPDSIAKKDVPIPNTHHTTSNPRTTTGMPNT